MILLDGKRIQKQQTDLLRERLDGCTQSFVVVMVGNNPDSETFVGVKKKFGEKIGVTLEVCRIEEGVSQKEIEEVIGELNREESVGGIIVQLPLPSQLDKQKVLDKILLEKDVDALSSLAQEAFLQTKTKQYVPATPRGILKLLQEYEIAISSKRIVVIGKSNIVGKPTAILLQEQGADVESCDKKTLNIPEKTKSADIIIVAAGAPKLVTKEYLDVNRDDYVIVDVGVTKDNNQKIHGDVDFEGVQSFTAAMSPVPGGVGPMTVLSLFENFADRIGK